MEARVISLLLPYVMNGMFVTTTVCPQHSSRAVDLAV